MGASVAGDWMGGGRCAYVRNVLCRGGPGDDYIRFIGVGHVPVYWEGAGQISPSRNMASDWEDAISEWLWNVDIPSPRGGNGGVGTKGDRNPRLQLSKHSRTIYCEKSHYGPVSGGRTAPVGTGVKVLVRSGEHWSGEDKGGDVGGGGGKGLMWRVVKILMESQNTKARYTVLFNKTVMEPNSPLSYATGLVHHVLTMFKIGGHVGQLEIER